MTFEEIKAKKQELGIKNNLTLKERELQKCEFMNNIQGNLNKSDGYNCDKCKNRGFITVLNEETLETVTRICSCKRIRDTLARAKASGLGDLLTDFTFDKYVTTEPWQAEIKEQAKKFCTDEKANVFYIGGQSGAGKTHICTAIAAYYLDHGKSCRYMLWRDDAVKLKQLVNDYEKYQPLMNDFKNAEVLYVDDLFKSQTGAELTKADINIAFELLNNRLMNKDKITIVSSELTIDKAMKFDEATMGRIYQAAGKNQFSISKDRAKNYRLKNAG